MKPLWKIFIGIAAVVPLAASGPSAEAQQVGPRDRAAAAPLPEDWTPFPGPAQLQEGAPAGPPARPPPGSADRDGDGLADELQAKLAGARPGDRFNMIVTLSGPGDAASAQAAVGPFNVHRTFGLISGFSATMTAAQARALARVPGVFRIEEDLTMSINMTDNENGT